MTATDLRAAADDPKAPLLTVRELTVIARHGERPRALVRDVSFELRDGETVAIVGESGSGKSMTARSIVGLLPAGVSAQGTITFGGRQLTRSRSRAMRDVRGTQIALLLQDPFTLLNPVQTVGEHIVESLPRDVRRNRKLARRQTQQRLEEVGLSYDRVARSYPFQLSGGTRQRVALAAALARDPQLLIADEPTSALDVIAQRELLELVGRLQRRRGMALLLITHDLRVAFTVSDRVVVMYAGSILERSPSSALRQAPHHPYTLGLLLADPPVTHFVDRLSFIAGSPPSATEHPAGCAFAARCRWCAPQCLATRPPLRSSGEGRASACLRLDQIAEEMRAEVAAQGADSPQPAAGSAAPICRFEDVGKRYRTRQLLGRVRETAALRGVSFEVGMGESVGLVGATGSGKTTLARCLMGLTRLDSGRIALGTHDVSDWSRLDHPERRRIRQLVQIVFQDPFGSLNPALTIGAALREAVRLRREGTGTTQVDELLASVGLPPSYASQRPAALSGGERQRVAIARAIAVAPRLLVCDEPVASLDVSVQAQILELLREIRRRDTMSLLFISHDLSVVRQMTERVVVLHDGEIVESGATSRVLRSPGHPYTARLLHALSAGQPGTDAHAQPGRS